MPFQFPLCCGELLVQIYFFLKALRPLDRYSESADFFSETIDLSLLSDELLDGQILRFWKVRKLEAEISENFVNGYPKLGHQRKLRAQKAGK